MKALTSQQYRVTSEKGEGFRFWLVVPLKVEHEEINRVTPVLTELAAMPAGVNIH